MPLPQKAGLALIALAATIGVVYGPIMAGLWGDWVHDPNYSHGFLIPVLSGFLLWQRRKELRSLPAAPSLAGIPGILAAAALLVLGVAGAEVFTQRVSLLLLLPSCVLFLGGWGWFRRTAFPLAFLLLAVPLPYVLYYGLTSPMQAFAAKCAVTGLNWAGVPSLSQGNIIHLPNTSLEVAEACSGIRSLYAFLALGALLARSLPAPTWVRMLVFLSTIPLSVAANAVRVWGSGIGAYTIGPSATEGTIHELFGLVIFAVAIILFLIVRQGARILWPRAS